MTAPVEPASLPRFDRADGPDKVTGSGRYTADLELAGMVHAAFAYSRHAHARILGIDTTVATAMPGVFAVLTAADVPDVRYTGGTADRRLFAADAVRYEGDVPTLCAELLSREIAVRQFTHGDPRLRSCVRITIGTPEENQRLIAALGDILG